MYNSVRYLCASWVSSSYLAHSFHQIHDNDTKSTRFLPATLNFTCILQPPTISVVRQMDPEDRQPVPILIMPSWSCSFCCTSSTLHADRTSKVTPMRSDHTGRHGMGMGMWMGSGSGFNVNVKVMVQGQGEIRASNTYQPAQPDSPLCTSFSYM